MNYRLIVLQQAESDLERNARWWAEHHSSGQADQWLWKVQQQIQTIRDLPESYALSAENDRFAFEIREKLVGFGPRRRYRAIFTIREKTVFVLAVRAAEEDDLTSDDLKL